jgi:thymidylate synthase (FAD)
MELEGGPMKIVPQSATLLAMTPDPMFLIERCGRVCYKSEEKCECTHGPFAAFPEDTGGCPDCLSRATKFVQGILKRGHESVLEHASATILLVTNRGMTHELVRHRIASYSQESTRYCNYGNAGGEVTVIEPWYFQNCPRDKDGVFDSPGDFGAWQAWRDSCLASEKAYLHMTGPCKIQPQYARDVLPTCLKTEIATTMNFREWRHVLSLRLSGSAGTPHPQIVELMKLVHAELMKSEAAPVFADFIGS